MKKIINYRIVFLVSICLLLTQVGCKKILNPLPVGQQTVDANFTDFNGSLTAVNGIYAQLTNGNLYRGNNQLINVDYASDDVLDDPQTVSARYSLIDYFEISANNNMTFQLWDDFYKIIHRSNVVIARVPTIVFPTIFETNGTGSSFKEQFIGEALFMRAFANFNLVRLFGDIPLRTKEITSANEVNIPRAKVADVYAQIEKDLSLAVLKLPISYTNSGNGNERGRVTKWSALGLLADVYLTQKKFTEARASALQVIQNNSGFHINNNYRDNFFPINGGNENTVESLFEIQFSSSGIGPTGTAAQGNNFAALMGPTTDAAGGVPSIAAYRPSDNASLLGNEPGFLGGLIQEYETGDLRLTTNFAMGRIGTGATILLTNKFYEPGRGSTGNGNYPVYRMAEMYLIYAEATNELGTPDIASIDYINQLRRRAFGLQLSTISARDIATLQTQISFRTIVQSERRKELAMENKRWFDMLRYGLPFMQDALVNKQKRIKFNQTKMLFPIAQIEIDLNPLIIQNPGY